MLNKTVEWGGGTEHDAVAILASPAGMIVSPTKVGYIIMTTDAVGLKRKFESKARPLSKPGVVLCTSLEQVESLAEMNGAVAALYAQAWHNDILLGCILPWKAEARSHIPSDGSDALMMDARGTSCFVVKFGTPSELIARDLWNIHGKLAFASSANPSGQGNRGRLLGVGEKILGEADLVIEADAYVASIQPGVDAAVRYEQGVMVSMVDEEGRLIPEQRGRPGTQGRPTLIRAGLDLNRIMPLLAAQFPAWDYRHGSYY